MLHFMVSMIGFLSAQRFLSDLAKDFALSSRIFAALAGFNLCFILVTAVISISSPHISWILIGIFLLSLNFFAPILRWHLSRRLFLSLLPLLDHVILGLQTGKSFRSSLIYAIEMQNGWIRNQLRDLYHSMLNSENNIAMKSALLKDLRAELIEIDNSNQRVLEQVKALRRQLKMQRDFRRRSGQVTQQIKMQAIIVTALFLGLLGFVIFQFGWHENSKIIFFSAFFFILGLIFIFSVGRRMKWKV